MPKQFDLLIFDWDGTLSDSTAAIVDALLCASSDLGFTIPNEQEARDTIGLELHAAFIKLLGDIDAATAQALTERYNHYYNAASHGIQLFDGVYHGLQELISLGFKLAVASGKREHSLRQSIEQANFTNLMAAVRSVENCLSKPHPQMLQEIMHELSVPQQRSLMIGDSVFDLQMAQNAGVASLGVSYGAQAEHALIPHKPLACFDNFATLHAWLRTNA
ncbi:MAG: HAD family hydrolase [Methylophilaceae bacterium]